MQADPSSNTFPLSENAPTLTHEGTTYQFISTSDGSPSIRMWRSVTGNESTGKDSFSREMPPEAMHHCAGALSESLYIYGSLLDDVVSRGWPPRILSVGLGCGYNEWIALATIQKKCADAATTVIESFESNSQLRETFKRWLSEESSDPFSALFTDVIRRVSAQFNIDATALKNYGRHFYTKGQWQIRERLDIGTSFDTKFNAIFFDAFSTKATPELWSDEFLDWFLRTTAETNCAFSTYAATGRLNRALKRAGFALAPFEGFSGKRESTRAFRGLS